MPNSEFRNLNSEIRNQISDIRTPASEFRVPKPELRVITDHWSGEISEMANLICADDFGATEAAYASSADSDPPAQDRPSYTTLATCPYLHLPTHQYLHLHLPLHQTTLANVAHQSLGTCLEPEVTNRRKITMNIVIRTKMMIISTILM